MNLGSQGLSKLMVCGGSWYHSGELGRDRGKTLERSWGSKSKHLGKVFFLLKSSFWIGGVCARFSRVWERSGKGFGDGRLLGEAQMHFRLEISSIEIVVLWN